MQHRNITLYAFLAFSFFSSWETEAGKELTLVQEDPPQQQRSLTLPPTRQPREQTYFPPLPQPPILQFNPLLAQNSYSYSSKNTIQRLGRTCDIPLLEAVPLDSLRRLCLDRLLQIPKDRAREIAKTTLMPWSLEQWIAIVEAADFQQIPAIQRPIGRNPPQQSIQDNRQCRAPKRSLQQQKKPFRTILPHSILIPFSININARQLTKETRY